MYVLIFIVACVLAFGTIMAVPAGGISCQFDLPIWLACLQTSAIGWFALVILPTLLLLSVGGLYYELRKRRKK